MDDSQGNNQTPKFDQEELDYLYALYKSSQAGSGIKLTKEELKKLLESERLNNKKEINENKIDKKILKLANFMTRTILKQIDYKFEELYGKEKWSEIDKFEKNQVIYLDFVKKFKFGPREMRNLTINILQNINKNYA